MLLISQLLFNLSHFGEIIFCNHNNINHNQATNQTLFRRFSHLWRRASKMRNNPSLSCVFRHTEHFKGWPPTSLRTKSRRHYLKKRGALIKVDKVSITIKSLDEPAANPIWESDSRQRWRRKSSRRRKTRQQGALCQMCNSKICYAFAPEASSRRLSRKKLQSKVWKSRKFSGRREMRVFIKLLWMKEGAGLSNILLIKNFPLMSAFIMCRKLNRCWIK